MLHVFDSEFLQITPATPIQQLRIAAPLAIEMLSEAAREIDADEATPAARAMLRIEAAVGIMRQLPASVIDSRLDITLADLGSAVMIGIYNADYIRRLTAQMGRDVSRITIDDDLRIHLDMMSDTPTPSRPLTAPLGYDDAAVISAAYWLSMLSVMVASDGLSSSIADDIRGVGHSLMRASRDLRYALAAEALMHMPRKGQVTAARLEAMADALLEDVDRVTADPSILGSGPLRLGIRDLDALLNPPPADPGPPSRSAQKRPKKPQGPTLEDVIYELRAIKSLI